MSDQEINPAEGVKTPVENPEVNTTESNTTPDNLEATGQETAETQVEGKEESKGNAQDATPDATENGTHDTPDAKGEEKTGTTDVNDELEKVRKERANKKWPSVKHLPKDMLKVNRKGCPEREKSDPSVLPDSDDPKAIRWQVEFYFSDSNLPKDKFLWEKTGGSKNKPVPLSLICSFSRMRRFKPYSAVVEALKTSQRLVIEGAEGEETVRRKEPCKPSKDIEDQIEERTTYIKGFGEETKTSQFDIEEFLFQYGEVNAVRLRRDDTGEDRVFKGSVFVEWANLSTAWKFETLKPQPEWKGHPLIIMPKSVYDRQSQEEERERAFKGHLNYGQHAKSGRGSHQSRGNHRGSDSGNWKQRREEDQRNGFNDRRGRRDLRGRGRGRGNNRGRGGDSAHHGNGEQQPVNRDYSKPQIQISRESEKMLAEDAERDAEAQANGKRTRDDDASADTPPAKKVNAKEAVVA
ncbi:hypothetical protein F5Y13DRAFT_139515 [Hypoxylon sp. FL1857]|nr:hypothetical protein F5Y13DRAFT_139515 [Hypoxylon sp. FL1857]